MLLSLLKDLSADQKYAVVTALRTERNRMEELREKERYNQMLDDIIHGGEHGA